MSINPMLYKMFRESLEGNFLAVLVVLAILLMTFAWWLRGLREDRKNFREFMDRMDDKVGTIQIRIGEILGRLPATVADAKSPLALNDLGKKIAGEIGIHEWVEEFLHPLQAKLEDKADPYEIQELCFRYAQNDLLDELRKYDPSGSLERKFKMSAYENGLALKQILDVAGIVLRDGLLKLCGLDTPDDLPVPSPHAK